MFELYIFIFLKLTYSQDQYLMRTSICLEKYYELNITECGIKPSTVQWK
jgi:hypothetical protein